jgi:uncharacterized membrane protein
VPGQDNAVSAAPTPQRVALAAVPRALGEGWRVLRRAPALSLAYGGVFAVIGCLLLWGVQLLGLAPLSIALVGGFLLVGPVAVAGLLGVADAVRAGGSVRAGLVFAGLRDAPRGLWAMAFFCLLVFFIWLSDAGTLYSFVVGERMDGFAAILPRGRLLPFHLSSSVMGAALACAVFVVTVHAVPLIAARRATLVVAVVASVRAVFRSPAAHLAWALVLAIAVFASAALPPLLAPVLPLLAYAGGAFHEAAFPRGTLRS